MLNSRGLEPTVQDFDGLCWMVREEDGSWEAVRDVVCELAQEYNQILEDEKNDR